MSQEIEPPIIDYARFYGLTRNHLEDDPLQQLAGSHGTLLDLEDDRNLFQIRADTVSVSAERLTLDEGAASILSSVSALAHQLPPHHDVGDEIDTHRVQRMKLEEPLLSSDPEVDLLHFAPPIVPNLEQEFLPLETVDEEADEGFGWPSRCHDLPREFDRRSKTEKLQVESDALVFLQEALNFHTKGGPHERFEDVEVSYTKKSKVEPVSSPLLPMSPEALPYIPSSDTGRIELLSDCSSPTRDELRQAERVIFADDAILNKKEAETSSQNSDPMLLDTESLGGIYSPLKSIGEPPSSPPIPVRSLRDRKVEVPLSPPKSEQFPPWKRQSVSFCEALTEVIQDLPLPIPTPENVSSDDIDAFFEETIRPIGTKAKNRIEQEQLQEADTTLRATVPVMDFSLPTAPWKANCQASKSDEQDTVDKVMSEVKAGHFSKDAWPLSGKIERELRWTPFPAALGKVETQETICDDNLIEEYVAQPDRVDVATLTWKPDGLRILDEHPESDEELEEGNFPEERDIESLVRKRKYELQADDSSSPPPRIENESAKTRHRSKLNQFNNRIQVTSDTFSALNALDSYMNVRKGEAEKPKLKAAENFPQAPKAMAQAVLSTTDTPTSALPDDASIPFPAITAPTSPIPFVVSTSFLSSRKLARRVQQLYPSAEFIERDFSLYSEPQERSGSKVNALPILQSSVADEADMILSPGTGLMLMTLQKIKQRSLPGQVIRSVVRERIIRTSPRYERLIILVNEGRSTLDPTAAGSSELTDSDCAALIEFTNFCSALESEVQTTFVAGGEDDFVKWICALMVKHGITDPDLKLIQDETLWEVFLRRAGMNAFAAQTILAVLKALDQADPETFEDYGLAAFLKMSMEERCARFETLLGGRQLLARVSKVLDARW